MSAKSANQVVTQKAQTEPRAIEGLLQRKCGCGTHTIAGSDCDSCKKEKGEGRGRTLQRTATHSGSVGQVPPIVHEVLNSPGRPLDPASRSYFEPRFGRDFSHIRVHADARAAESAEAVSALAYTVGDHIVFGSGRYDSRNTDSRKLLAHELTHTIQQQGMDGWFGGKLEIGMAHDFYEQQADWIAEHVMQGNRISTPEPALNTLGLVQPFTLQRAPEDYAGLTITQLRRRAITDPDAAEALRLRYRAMSNIDLERFARNDPMAQSVYADRLVVAAEAEGQGQFERPGMRDSLAREIQQERARIERAGGTPRRAPSVVDPGGRTQGGTIGAAQTDIPGLEGRTFIGRSPQAGGAVNPQSQFPPATDPAVLPQTHGHAEQAIADQLELELRAIPREQLAGRRVWMLIEQEPCATCAMEEGVLRRLSRAFPELTFEVKNLDSSAVIVLRNGTRVAQGATPAAAAAAAETPAPQTGGAPRSATGAAAAETPGAATAVAEAPGAAPAARPGAAAAVAEVPAGAAAATAETPGAAAAAAQRPPAGGGSTPVQVGTEIRALSSVRQPNGLTISEIEYIFGENLEHVNRGAPAQGRIPSRMVMRVTQNAEGVITAVESLSGQPQTMAEALVRQTLPRALTGELAGAEGGMVEGATAAGGRGMARLATGLKIGGWVAFGVITGYQLATATPAERPRVLAQAGGGLAGGMMTGYVVCNVLLGIETLGWSLVICGFVAGGVGGYAGSEVAGAAYDEATATDLDRALQDLERAPRNVRVLFNVLVGQGQAIDAAFVRRFMSAVPYDLRDYELVILAGQLGTASTATIPAAPSQPLVQAPPVRTGTQVDTVCPNCHQAAAEQRPAFSSRDLSETDVQSIASWIASQPQYIPPAAPPADRSHASDRIIPPRAPSSFPTLEEQQGTVCPSCHQGAGEQRRPDFPIIEFAALPPSRMATLDARLETLRGAIDRLPERQRAPGDISHRPSPAVPAAVQPPARPTTTPQAFPTVREQLGTVCPNCHRAASETRSASPLAMQPTVTDQDLATVARWIQSAPPPAAQPATRSHATPAGVAPPRPTPAFPSVAQQTAPCPSCHQSPTQPQPLTGSLLDRMGGAGTGFGGQASAADRQRLLEWIQAVEQTP